MKAMKTMATLETKHAAVARPAVLLHPLLHALENSVPGELAINEPGDHHEQEADQAAELVMAQASGSSQGSDDSNYSKPTRAQSSHAGGQPLDSRDRSFMESGFGHDFSQIRVHTDNQAASLAGGLNARAFTMGQNIVFGEGQYAPGTSKGQRLLAHELTHTIQQQTGASNLNLQRDIIDDVEEKLSYSIVDWAVTDSEAMEALGMLGTLAPAALTAGLARLGEKYTSRLLDNLPEAAKSGEIYQRVIRALGSAGVSPFAREQLEYGFFDWAITDEEVTRVFNLFANFAPPEQERFLKDLDNSARLGRLIDNSNAGHHALYIRPWLQTLTDGALTLDQQNILRTIVRNTSDSQMETLMLATRKRFNVAIGPSSAPSPGQTPVPWDFEHLRQTYLTLDRLPAAHVAQNREFRRLGQFREPATPGATPGTQVLTTGVYDPNQRELNINIEKPVDQLASTIIHETAHAVDEEMGWSAGAEPAKPERGGWKVYGANYHDCAVDMVDDSAGGIKTKLTAPQRTDVITDMESAMSNRSAATLESNIRGHGWFSALAQADKDTVMADRAIPALGIGLNAPWFNATGGGEHLGPHVYEEGYPNEWCRYRHEARSRFISSYQFRFPSEWFAEAYRLYYTQDPGGFGARLNAIDPNTKIYFDTHVNTRAASR